ncbi:MAG: copper-binding protein [Thermoanaerobaculia bacterium]|nr:copper-binding protein [Thermoanaerobaculia bacterium]
MPLLQASSSLSPRRLLALLFVATVSWVGCGGEPSPSTPADASYRVQGVVQRITGDQRGYREIVVRHQSVPDFRNREGEVVGMGSMAMPFAVAPALDLDDLAPQDQVAMTFEVRWEGEPVLLIVELEELPVGTEVDFGTPVPPPVSNSSNEEQTGDQPPNPAVDLAPSEEAAPLEVEDESRVAPDDNAAI